MLNTPCPSCGKPKNPNAQLCKPCANESRRRKLTGRKHPPERVRKNSEAQKRRHAAGGTSFDIAAHMKDRPHPFALPPGTIRIVKDGRAKVRCEDGEWRYRSRVVWAETHGPIPRGYVIHHVNCNPLDDRLENLQMLTISEHMKLHAELRRQEAGR